MRRNKMLSVQEERFVVVKVATVSKLRYSDWEESVSGFLHNECSRMAFDDGTWNLVHL